MEQKTTLKSNIAQRFQDEDTIDLFELFLQLKRRIVLIVLSAFIFACAAFAGTKFLVVPQYKSTSMMYILSKDTTLTSLTDLQIGISLTDDYLYICTSRPVLQEVVDRLGLDMTYGQLNGCVSIKNPEYTRILTITASHEDPVTAKAIADTMAEVSSDFIADAMEMVPPKIIETGVVATSPYSPNRRKNTMIGALFGAMLVCGLVTLEYLMNDAVTTSDDVDKYLELPVLAVVPERAGAAKEKDDKHKTKRKRKRV